jgi:hypothetical protein
VDDLGEDARRRNFDDHPVRYSIEILGMIAYLVGVSYVSAQLNFPSQQLVLAAGLALGLLLLKLTRSVRR